MIVSHRNIGGVPMWRFPWDFAWHPEGSALGSMVDCCVTEDQLLAIIDSQEDCCISSSITQLPIAGCLVADMQAVNVTADLTKVVRPCIAEDYLRRKLSFSVAKKPSYFVAEYLFHLEELNQEDRANSVRTKMSCSYDSIVIKEEDNVVACADFYIKDNNVIFVQPYALPAYCTATEVVLALVQYAVMKGYDKVVLGTTAFDQHKEPAMHYKRKFKLAKTNLKTWDFCSLWSPQKSAVKPFYYKGNLCL